MRALTPIRTWASARVDVWAYYVKIVLASIYKTPHAKVQSLNILLSSQKNASMCSYQNMGERSGRRLSLLRKTCFGPQWEAKKKYRNKYPYSGNLKQLF